MVIGTSASIFTFGFDVAGNPEIGAVVVDSTIVLNSNIYKQSNKLDIVSPDYYDNGYNNMSLSIIKKTMNI